MENKPQTDGVSPKVSGGNSWFAGYIVAGIIWYLGQNFSRTSYDGIIVLIIAVLCGYFYHWLKGKISIKTEWVRIVVTFVILEIISGFVVGILTSLI